MADVGSARSVSFVSDSVSTVSVASVDSEVSLTGDCLAATWADTSVTEDSSWATIFFVDRIQETTGENSAYSYRTDDRDP